MSFGFDLQRFAEEEAMQSAGQETAQPAVVQSASEIESDNGQPETAPEPKYGLMTDEKTGRRVVREIAKEEAQSENTAAQEVQTEPLQAEPPLQENKQRGLVEEASRTGSAQPYAEPEFLLALQMGNVDETRVPQQYAMQYGAYKVRCQLEEQTAAQQRLAQELPQETPQKDTQRAFYERIATMAHEKALAATGMTQEEYDAARYNDDEMEKMRAYTAAYQWHEGEIVKGALAQRDAQQKEIHQREAIYRDIGSRITEMKAQEPHFAEIDELMLRRYQTLPYQEAKDVAQTITALQNGTITPQQCKILEKYYEDTRLAFYAQQNNLPQTPKPKPPAVETPGSGESLPQNVDFAAMRNMNVRERRAFISNYFKNK